MVSGLPDLVDAFANEVVPMQWDDSDYVRNLRLVQGVS